MVRQAISVFKKRTGSHERTIRELRLTPGNITVGEALREFEGILTGLPRFVGKRGKRWPMEATSMPGAEPREETVLVLAPTGRDARLIAGELGRHGFGTHTCALLEEASDAIAVGAGMGRDGRRGTPANRP